MHTELKLISQQTVDKVDVYIKHVGIDSEYQYNSIKDIEISYDNETHLLNWTQPIKGEEFKYIIYLDKMDSLKEKDYTLCTLTEGTKLGHYSEIITTATQNPNITIDFSKPELGQEYKDFDVIIVAEQINKGQITILSTVYDSEGNKKDEPQPEPDSDGNNDDGGSGSKIGLFVVIGVLAVAIIAGAIFAFIIYRKYKSRGEISKKTKETSMALINSAKGNLLTSQGSQIDP